MKQFIVAVIMCAVVAQPAHAGVLRKVFGAPFWVVGFTVALVADVVAVPFKQGAKHYIDSPAMPGW
jgi:hypothetical protein